MTAIPSDFFRLLRSVGCICAITKKVLLFALHPLHPLHPTPEKQDYALWLRRLRIEFCEMWENIGLSLANALPMIPIVARIKEKLRGCYVKQDTEQPCQSVRKVLVEAAATRMRISIAAKKRISELAVERGCPEWLVVDQLVGCGHD